VLAANPTAVARKAGKKGTRATGRRIHVHRIERNATEQRRAHLVGEHLTAA